jgi:hypothetical protein
MGDNYMSIAAMSVGMHQQQATQDLGTAVLKKAMETVEGGTEQLLSELSSDPNLGANVDILA